MGVKAKLIFSAEDRTTPWDERADLTKHLIRFAKLVAAKEREACADIAENWNSNGMPRIGVAAQIRARGEA